MILSDFEVKNTNQSPMPRSFEENGGVRYDSDFARIEELIKGNTFSGEEITHLMDVLNSRMDNEREKLKSISAGGDAQLVSRTPEIPKTPSEGKHVIDRTIVGASRENSDVPVGVSASPIDIARAYMANRAAEGGEDLHSFMPNMERAQSDYEFTRKPPLFPLASPNPSICWPGAVVHDRSGLTTPQSQRVRHRLHDFSGTPYSRTVLSKSTAKLQADSGLANTSSPFQRSPTSIYEVKSRGEIVDAYGSVGPIRRIRNKFASEVRHRVSIFPSSSKGTPKSVKAKGFGGLLTSTEKNFEPGETSGVLKYMSRDKVSSSSDKRISNPNVSSSQAARTVLEHLDRTKSTPKLLEDEWKFANGFRRSSPEAMNVSNVENTSSELASHNNTDAASPSFPFVFNKSSSSKSNFSGNFNDKGKDEIRDAVNGNSMASSSIITCSKSANAKPFFGLDGTSGSTLKFSDKNAFATSNYQQADARSLFSRPHLTNGQDGKAAAGTSGSDLPKNHGTKPSLSSISINKPVFAADNGPGFTFPVSASSGVNSEPPTPSINPSSSASIPSQPPTSPSYTFGTKKSAPDLVFSFPSTSTTSSASTHDASDLKFSFGLEKKPRLSFNSFGKDAVCY